MISLLIGAGLLAAYFMSTSVNFPLITNNTLWQAVDPSRYLPGIKDSVVRDKRSRVGQPQVQIRNPFGPSNVFQHNIEYMPPFVTTDYSVAYARNYSNVGADLRTQDWRLDPNFAGTVNNYSGYYTPEDILGNISKHGKSNNIALDRWNQRK